MGRASRPPSGRLIHPGLLPCGRAPQLGWSPSVPWQLAKTEDTQATCLGRGVGGHRSSERRPDRRLVWAEAYGFLARPPSSIGT